ncbi:MAG: hypothetical protein AAB853_06055 [Patescibacteria group bacterium]
MKKQTKRRQSDNVCRWIGSAAALALFAGGFPLQALSATTLLVNNESFDYVGEGDGTTPIELRFGEVLNEKLLWHRDNGRFELTDDLSVQGSLSGSSLRVDGGANVHGALTASGAVRTDSDLTINDDQTAADATLTFGNDAGNKTLKFSDTFNEFEFSDDLRITGNLSASGAVSFDGATSFNNVQYTWPESAATASGRLLSVDPSTGKLSWTSGSASSGSIISLKPTYPNATYFGSGASKVGTLSALYSSGSSINYYRWQTTKTTAQQYWIATQVRIPNTFRSWDPVKPIQFSYRGSGGSLNVKLLDTNDTIVPLSGGSGLTGANWQIATITGPESSGTFTADDYMTFLLKMTASGSGLNNEFADAGFIELNWETKD